MTIELTEDDADRTIEIPVGTQIIVRLQETPGGGYRWEIECSNDEALTLEDNSYAPSPSSAVGGGGQRTLTLKAQRTGAAHIRLKNRRPWEEAPAREIGIQVQVVPRGT